MYGRFSFFFLQIFLDLWCSCVYTYVFEWVCNCVGCWLSKWFGFVVILSVVTRLSLFSSHLHLHLHIPGKFWWFLLIDDWDNGQFLWVLLSRKAIFQWNRVTVYENSRPRWIAWNRSEHIHSDFMILCTQIAQMERKGWMRRESGMMYDGVKTARIMTQNTNKTSWSHML